MDKHFTTLTRRQILALMASAWVEAAFLAATAQEPQSNAVPTKRAVLKNRITQDLRAWDSVTDHRTGTAGDNATAKWLAKEIEDAGLKPTVDEFVFKRRVLNECSVTVGGTRIVGVPLFDGGVTGPNPIRAKLGRLGDAGTIALTLHGCDTGGEMLES